MDHNREWGEPDPSYSDTLMDEQPFCPSGTDPFGEPFGEPLQPQTGTAATATSSFSSSSSSSVSSAAAGGGGRPQPLMSFDEVPERADSSFGAEEEPSSLVNVSGLDLDVEQQMTSSYQQALQHASLAGLQDLGLGDSDKDSLLLMTNGDAQQQQQGNDGYFSQGNESGHHEDTIPKMPMYSTPPAIDVTCWDADGDD